MRTPTGQRTDVFGGVSLTRALWPHQVRALTALDRARADQGHGDRGQGNQATYIVVPPGGGKTLIGLEAARRLGRPTVVLCPNTAIQAQWMAQWQAAFSPAEVTATASRERAGRRVGEPRRAGQGAGRRRGTVPAAPERA